MEREKNYKTASQNCMQPKKEKEKWKFEGREIFLQT